MSLLDYHVIGLLKKQLETQPEAIALQGYDAAQKWQQLSWQQFQQHSDKIACTLLDLGLNYQERVAIWSPNCPQWTCVDVALLKMKAISVPIHATCTTSQAAYILQDSQAKFLVVYDQAQYQHAAELQLLCPSIEYIIVIDPLVTLLDHRHLYLDQFISPRHGVSPESAEQLLEAVNSPNLADFFTILYTSGTTDMKGVLLDFRNLAHAIRQHDSILDLQTAEISLAFLPLSHIFERIWSYYVLCRGGKNVYLTNEQNIKPALLEIQPHVMCVVPRFLEKIYGAAYDNGASSFFSWAIKQGQKKFRAAQFNLFYSPLDKLFHFIADKLVLNNIRQIMGGRIRFMPCGGAALSARINLFFQAVEIPILSGYGLTETTATATCNTLQTNYPGTNGRSLPTVEIKVSDRGEVLVRGETVTRGYFNRPKDNEEAFIDGWFKTGDAGFIDSKGNLIITDRLKDLMKTSSGQFIAPQKIESVLGACTFISQVGVVADNRPYPSALIVPNFENLETWARSKHIRYKEPEDLLTNEQIQELYSLQLEQLQAELAPHEQIKKFVLISKPFTVAEGLLTPTLKLRRKAFYRMFSEQITALYRLPKKT